jgi:hypothetical protein
MRSPRTIYTREGVGRGGKTRVRTGSLAAVSSDGRLLARVSSSHGRADGGDRRQSATQNTLVAEGMPDIGPGARRYIGKPVITSGSGPTSVPLVASHCFSEPTGRNNLGTETERTRRAGATRSSYLPPNPQPTGGVARAIPAASNYSTPTTHAWCGGVARNRVGWFTWEVRRTGSHALNWPVSGTCRSNGRTGGLPPAS